MDNGGSIRNDAEDGRRRVKFAVELNHISKSFGSVRALEEVDLHVEQGSIHAVVGENGAGKTTLMKVLYGAINADSGQVVLDGNPVTFKSSGEAIDCGVGMVSQHYGIIPDLTCLQNLILGAEGGALLNLSQAEQRAESLAQKMGFQFEWRRDAAELSPAGAQKLEILKLLWRNSQVMILDEPTAMLSPADGEALFQSLRLLVAEGKTVILVTHRLPEVFGHCSRVTVLRGGKKVAERAVTETNPAELAELIVGKKLEAPSVHTPVLGDLVLEVQNLDVRGYRGDLATKSINLKIQSGELVGIAGVDGSGQRELFRALQGTASVVSGEIIFGNIEATKLRGGSRIQWGLRSIPEDRHSEAVIEDWSLEENASLGLQQLSPFAKNNLIQEKERMSEAEKMALMFQTKHGGLDQPMSSLSGGNQQRFVAARALWNAPKLILAFQPARGLDLAATREVYEGLRKACDNGAGALIVSYDLDELLEHCDRIVVMNRGELIEPGQGQERDRNVIGCLMVGAA